MAKRVVLAIEHDWRLRRLLQANLEPFDLEVRLAVNGQHCLGLLRTGRPDLVLLDTDLPDMDVAHLLDCLRAQFTDQVPVIVLSAEPLSSSLGQNGRAIRYLRKPFATPDLLRQVLQMLDGMATGEEETASRPL